MSTEENFFKTGTLRIGLNTTAQMDVRYFVNARGFHVADLQRPLEVPIPPQVALIPPNVAETIFAPANNRTVRQQVPRANRPIASPRLLTGERLGQGRK